LLLIALFVLFVATWIALLLAKQISVPISALLDAASQVRKGNLGHRVNVIANDEMGSLVRGFNEMVHGLEDNSRELESRRRFTSDPREHSNRVISPSPEAGSSVNQRCGACSRRRNVPSPWAIFPIGTCSRVALPDGARAAHGIGREPGGSGTPRPGSAPCGNGFGPSPRTNRCAGLRCGPEDTSEMLCAQKAEAWHEVLGGSRTS
jgi:HAMP domain-containing protein